MPIDLKSVQRALPVDPAVYEGFVFPEGFGYGVREVLDGEYDIPHLTFEKLGRAPVAIDAGGNCGSFSFWVRKRFPGIRVIAYEPHPKNVPYFRRNCPDVELHEVALVASGFSGQTVTLFDGIDGDETGSGQASLECRGGQKLDVTFEVPALQASKLPPCDLLEIDTEGWEKQILFGYKHLKDVAAVMLEFHTRKDQFVLGAYLEERGFHCVDQLVDKPRDRYGRTYGLLKFMRPEFMTECAECRMADGRRRGYLRTDGRYECVYCDQIFK